MQSSADRGLLLIGATPASRALLEDIQSAARTYAKVLILGETGVGKELVAQLIHARSSRRTHPFVAVNCSGIPETLLESELFGHVRGSFTGAYRDKPGLARRADGGTLFLDELGEMSLRMQAVLLRFTETGEIQPIGADRTTAHTDARLIAATNRDLKALVAAQAFREDLYYRLNVIQICVPPLRDRRDDVPALLEHFLEFASLQHRLPPPALSAAAQQCLREYAWPGNIRELKNVIERLVVRDFGRPVQVDDLPEEVRSTFVSSRRPALPPPIGDAVRPAASEAIPADAVLDRLWRQLHEGGTFWTCVAEPFRHHDLTRMDVHALVQRGLNETQGSYRALLDVFNLPATDYKRVLSFLRQHDCHVPFQRFRGVRPRSAHAEPRPPSRAVS
jgi:transcriptional regulator with GAF, ATPase, and Fis domain